MFSFDPKPSNSSSYPSNREFLFLFYFPGGILPIWVWLCFRPPRSFLRARHLRTGQERTHQRVLRTANYHTPALTLPHNPPVAIPWWDTALPC